MYSDKCLLLSLRSDISHTQEILYCNYLMQIKGILSPFVLNININKENLLWYVIQDKNMYNMPYTKCTFVSRL
jgi:hypothetical protein